MSKLNLVCGIPGSGKSTYIRSRLTDDPHAIRVSRDEIRFHYLDTYGGDDYFAYENDVWKTFVKEICNYLNNGYNVWADQTSLNYGSRRKILSTVTAFAYPEQIDAYWFNCPLQIAAARNAQREGRERVPDQTLVNMFNFFMPPTKEEGFDHVVEIQI